MKRSSIHRSLWTAKVGEYTYYKEPITHICVCDDYGNLVQTNPLLALNFLRPVYLYGE